ncbi:unnamed protein product [Brassica napus]|uniref:(rape) hypothetical protein n=1 Tax=Brassica napus TaxID=3708 RepID=A0A816K512_BRANA|nr:unnamed protein product [Brassica napus]
MYFASCVCLDEPLYVGTCVFFSSSESVNGAKAGQNEAQEPSSSKELSLVIANEPEVKPSELSGEPSVLVLDKGVPTDSDLQKGKTRRQTKKDVAMVYVCGKSERAKKLAVPQQSPFKENNTAKVIILNKRVGQGYDPFAPVDKKMLKVLTDWVKLDPNEHWIDKWISIPKKNIVVWDSIISHISPEELDVFCNKNAKAIREKMVVDIFKETSECHSKENKDNDENLGTYDEQEGLRGVKSSGRLTRRSSTSFLTWWTCMASFFAWWTRMASFISFSIAPTKISILISSVSPDHALLLEESMCVPQLVVQHKDIYSLNILQTKYPLSKPGIQVWRYANHHMIQQL